MARFHVSTNTPTKLELMAEWLPKQPWAPATGGAVEPIGTFHFDDPEGEVGMQTHLVKVDRALLHVPLTYRATPLEGGDAAFVGEMHHRVLGPRFVYDGLGDHRYLIMLAAATLTGFGQSLGMAIQDGQWAAWPSDVRVEGGRRGAERVVVDGFSSGDITTVEPTFRNDQFDLTLHRRPVSGARPPIGLTATWTGSSEPVVLAEIHER